jgi:hypothetical protein
MLRDTCCPRSQLATPGAEGGTDRMEGMIKILKEGAGD